MFAPMSSVLRTGNSGCSVKHALAPDGAFHVLVELQEFPPHDIANERQGVFSQ